MCVLHNHTKNIQIIFIKFKKVKENGKNWQKLPFLIGNNRVYLQRITIVFIFII